jgi:DNA-binding XRE family transcriptional regulator
MFVLGRAIAMDVVSMDVLSKATRPRASNCTRVKRLKRGAAQAAEFGERVRECRQKLDLSQEKLAERCGLHRTYIGHLERGEVNPTLYNILLVAHGLEVDAGKLIEDLRP